jgi:hypothetical protein
VKRRQVRKARALQNEHLIQRVLNSEVWEVERVQQDIAMLPEAGLRQLIPQLEHRLSEALYEKHRCDAELKLSMARAELHSIEEANRRALRARS